MQGNSSFTVPAVLCVLAVLAAGQSVPRQATPQRFHGPAGRVHYDVPSGKVTKLVRPGQRGATANAQAGGVQKLSLNCFLNTITTGYFAAPPVGAEWVDWASKNTGKTITTSIIFGYATVSPGFTVDIGLNFYSGTTGFCTLGALTDGFTFSGLPGTSASLPPGFSARYFVTAFLGNQGICVPDGRIGWGYCSLDSDGSGGAMTGPILTDFGTNTGWNDAYDQWSGCPANTGTCVGAFFFGGCSTGAVPPPPTGVPCASFMLGLTEWVPASAASCTFCNAGTNPAILAATPPVIGGLWTLIIGAPLGIAAVCTGPLAPFPLAGLVNGLLLVDLTLIAPLAVLAPSAIIPLPKDIGLEGLTFSVQAARFNFPGNWSLTNRQDCVFGGYGSARPPVGHIDVTATTPHLADGVDATLITVLVFDTGGRPLAQANPFLGLRTGDDDLKEVAVTDHGNGTYSGSMASEIAGAATVLARDRHCDVLGTAEVLFLAGPAEQVLMSVGALQGDPAGDWAAPLDASVRDAFYNVVLPPDADLRWSTTLGAFSSVQVDEFGTSLATLESQVPGTAIVTATDLVSALYRTFDVSFPAIRLRCPPAVHLTGLPGEDRTFEVAIDVFPGPSQLGAYDLFLQMNALTGFVQVQSGSPDGAYPPPQVQFVAPDVIEVTAFASPFQATSGVINVATLVFECLDEGNSVIDIPQAFLYDPALTPLQDGPREPGICPNKRVLSLCVNPIIVEQPGFAPTDADKDSIIRQLVNLQECFDKECCKILLKVRDKKKALKAPKDLRAGDLAVMDLAVLGGKVDEGLLSWDATKPNPDILIGADLIEVMSKSKTEGLRDNDCVNVYFVSTLGWKKPDLDPSPLAGADVKSHRIGKNGMDCEPAPQKLKRFNGEELTPAADFEGAFVSKGNFENPNDKTMKHELGHMLGLQHPPDYDPAVQDEIVGADRKGHKSVMLDRQARGPKAGFTAKECEIIQKDCNARLGKKPLGC